MSKENIDVARRMWRAYDQSNFDAFAACVTLDWKEYDGDAPVETLEDMRGLMRMQSGAFGDKHTEFLVELAEGDLVAQLTVTTATHTGRYFDLEPTGKVLRMHQINIHRVAKGRIVETWIAVVSSGGFYELISGRKPSHS